MESELVWLADRAAEHRSIVEIGSYLGRSTRAMLDNTEGTVYAIDDWKGPRDIFMEKRERDQLYGRFLQNVHNYLASPKLVIMARNHRQMDFDYGKADMVFLDGSHEYEDVRDDILFWKKRLLPNGLLCGHDIQMSSVQSAVAETLGEEVDVAPNTTIWYTYNKV